MRCPTSCSLQLVFGVGLARAEQARSIWTTLSSFRRDASRIGGLTSRQLEVQFSRFGTKQNQICRCCDSHATPCGKQSKLAGCIVAQHGKHMSHIVGSFASDLWGQDAHTCSCCDCHAVTVVGNLTDCKALPDVCGSGQGLHEAAVAPLHHAVRPPKPTPSLILVPVGQRYLHHSCHSGNESCQISRRFCAPQIALCNCVVAHPARHLLSKLPPGICTGLRSCSPNLAKSSTAI